MNHRLRSGCCTTAVRSGSSTNFCKATLAVSSWAAGGGAAATGGGAVGAAVATVVPAPPGSVAAGVPGAAVAPGAVVAPGARVTPGASVTTGVVDPDESSSSPAQAVRDIVTTRPSAPHVHPERDGGWAGRMAEKIRDAWRRAAACPQHTGAMLFAELATVSEQLAATSKRGQKAGLLAAVLRRLAPAEVAPAVGFLTGSPVQGRIGVGWATLRDARHDPATEPSLTVGDIHEAIDRLAAMSGAGVTAARQRLLADVFGRATESEQDLLWRVFSGEMRQGALDGVMVDAVAKAAAVPVASVRRATMMSGDLRRGCGGGADRR